MKSRCLVSLFVVGLFTLGTSANAWSQDCCKRASPSSCKGRCGCEPCRPCGFDSLGELLGRIDCALQRLLPCRRCCSKTACDAKSACKAEPTSGGDLPPVPVPPQSKPDPFSDDELEPAPMPATEAKHIPRDYTAARSAGHRPSVRTFSASPGRFTAMDALPLPTKAARKKSVLRKATSTASATSAANGKSEPAKLNRPQVKAVRLAEFVLP